MIKKYYEIYKECQYKDRRPISNIIHFTSIIIIFEKVTIDIIYILRKSKEKKYLIIRKEDLIKWPKTRTLIIIDSTNIAKFL